MEPTEQPKRRANRKSGKGGGTSKTKTVAVSEDAFVQVEQCAKKLKMSKAKFTSAAITFFAESGLDPTQERPQGLAGVSQKVEAGVANVRTHNADIGNRLYAMTRGFEKTIYQFMQQQQHATYAYMEAVESNLLRHLVALETNLLNPMIEEIVKGNIEAYVGRIIGERAYLKVSGRAAEEWGGQHEKFSGERDQLVVASLREFIKEHKVPVPRASIKPGATPVPPKPVAPASEPATVAPTVPPATPKS